MEEEWDRLRREKHEMACFTFLLGSYAPETDANVTCCMNVIEHLKKEGHEVVCVCGTLEKNRIDCIDDVDIYRVHHNSYDYALKSAKSKWKMAVLRISHFLHSVCVLPFFPNTEIGYSIKLYRELKRVGKEKQIDCVIGVFRPFATVQAAIWYGKKYKCKTVGYYLDVLKGADIPTGAPNKIYHQYCDFKEKRVFEKLDTILMAENGKEIYSQASFRNVHDKIRYVNFPTLLIKEMCETVTKGLCVYAGTTYHSFRNPKFMINVFLRLAEKYSDIKLHMYGKSECVNELKNYEKQSEGAFVYYGQVEKKVADDAIWHAEYLINIGNGESVLVPSKIFELVGYKKPIIHFAKSRKDSSLPYLLRHPEACIVFEEDGIESAVISITDFFKKERILISDADLRQEFYAATPDAVALELERCVSERKESIK